MIAHYGYQDAEGSFYITIDQDRCAGCALKPCVSACPRTLLVEEVDPYGDAVVAVDDRKRKALKYECMDCKPAHHRRPLPCVVACPCNALTHSWE